MNPVLPFIMILRCAIVRAVALFILKRPQQIKGERLNERQKTAQEFVNVKNTRDRFLYTRDSQGIEIHPIRIVVCICRRLY